MMTTQLLSCLFFLQTLFWKGQVFGNSNGDSLLYLNGTRDLTNTQGILQIFIYRWNEMDFSEGEWVNVCSKRFNRGGAAAVCRQLGYTDVIDYGPYNKFSYELNTNISQYVLTEALCPSVSNYTKYGETHILRCSYYGNIANSSESQCIPVGIKCATNLLTAVPYIGQLTLYNRTGTFHYSISSGYLSMYYRGQWYPVCANVSYFGSASVCRQLGATSISSTYADSQVTALGVHLGDPSCIRDTYACTDHCYNEANFKLKQCRVVHLVCTFLIKDGPVRSSGSQQLCQILTQSPTKGTTYLSVGLSVSLGIVCSYALIFTIIMTVYVCYSRRSEYKKIGIQ